MKSSLNPIHHNHPLRLRPCRCGRIAGFLLLTVLIAPLHAEENPAGELGAGSPPWTAADYARHHPATFRRYAPAQQVIRRDAVNHALLAAAIHFATNEQRIRRKLPPLTHSEPLRRAAQLHSHKMAVGDFFAHDNPRESTHRTPWQRMAAEGVAGGYRSENIAKSWVNHHTYLSAADAIVAMWMKSPGHRRNLLDPKMRYLGCGVHACRCPQFHLLATQNFSSSTPK